MQQTGVGTLFLYPFYRQENINMKNVLAKLAAAVFLFAALAVPLSTESRRPDGENRRWGEIRSGNAYLPRQTEKFSIPQARNGATVGSGIRVRDVAACSVGFTHG